MRERKYKENTRDTPPYIGSEAWKTSEWEMLGRISDERREAKGERPSTVRSDVRSGREERE